MANDTTSVNPWAIRRDKVRYWFKKLRWLIPLVLAVVTLVGVLVAVPLSGNSAPDKMTGAFVALAAASVALVVGALAWHRRTFAVAHVGLVVLYMIMAVPTALAGVMDMLPDGAYRHRFGAPLLLALSAAGTMAVFASLLLGWLAPQMAESVH